MKSIARVGVSVMLATSFSVFTGGSSGGPAGGLPDQASNVAKLIRSEKLTDGGKTKQVTFTNPAGKVVGAASVGRNARVAMISNGENGNYEMSVKPVDPTTDEEVAAMAAELNATVVGHRQHFPEQANGHAKPPGVNRPAPRLAAVGAVAPKAGAGSGSTPIYDVGCLYVTAEVYVKGCYYRRTVPESMGGYYLRADSSEIFGHHSGTWGYLRGLRSIHDYDTGYAGTEVISSRPMVTRDGDNCRETSISISYGVFDASMPVELCPDRLDPYARQTYFRHAWYGSVSRDSIDRASVGHSITRGRVGHGIGFDYRIQAKECDDVIDWDGIDCDWRTAG
jgi:hypothetical protein